MSKVAEIEAAIEQLSPEQVRELADWFTKRLGFAESPAILRMLDVGIHSLESEPTVPAEEVRRKIKVWATG